MYSKPGRPVKAGGAAVFLLISFCLGLAGCAPQAASSPGKTATPEAGPVFEALGQGDAGAQQTAVADAAAMMQLHLSARAYHHIPKLARTTADLAGSEEIQPVHLAEALQYQPKLMMGQ